MGGPAWLTHTFAVAMLVISAYCAARLAAAGVRRRETELDADGTHLAMGVAMAGMLAPGLRVAPAAAWTAVFAVASAWFAWQELRVRRGLGAGRWRCPYPVPHLAEGLAMVYMLVAARAASGTGPGARMAGMGGASGMVRAPELAALFAVFMVGYVAWLGDRFTSVAAVIAGRPGVPSAGAASAGAAASAGIAQSGGCWPALAPRGACCYKLVMSIVMGYMLIVML